MGIALREPGQTPGPSPTLSVPERPKESGRLYELDGLRGIACLVVFASHAVAFFPGGQALQSWRLSALWDGTAAVVLFFVLSGFVLSLPFAKTDRPMNYGVFVFKRVMRLYPAYWAALILAAAFRALHDPTGMAHLSAWAASFWNAPISLHQVVLHAAMIWHGMDSHLIDPVIWTMVIEMKMSLFVPLIIVAMRFKRDVWWGLALLAVSLVLGAKVDLFYFLPEFTLGVFLASHYGAISGFFKRNSRAVQLSIAAIGLFLWSNERALRLFPAKIGDHLTGLGSALLIVCVATDPLLLAFFRSKPVHFLGKSSYSFYLIHLPVLLFVASLLHPAGAGIGFAIAVAGVVSLLLAWGLYTAVEAPAQKAANRIAARFGKTR